VSRWLETFFDVTAQKPSGWLGRLMYRHPLGHYGFFQVALDRLQLQPEDVLLEIGCGGGVLVDMALKTAGRVWGIDHGPDMVTLAHQKNRRALSEGRAGVVHGEAEVLPWAGSTFTCATGVEVLYFMQHPRRAFRELYRVLRPGGRLVLVTGAEPKSALSRLASCAWLRYLRFYSDQELASMLEETGFHWVQVKRVDRSEHTVYAHQLVLAVK
jgi:ubiquinone/menaquinone biosynthesis C-methylase UbiE